MELKVINEIKRLGLEKFVSKYSMKYKDHGHKFLLKYDQLNTKKNPITNECRGIIVSKDLETVISLPLIRFSNYNESSRKSINWDSFRVFEKTDGTMIQFYYDQISEKWCVGTGGVGEASDPISSRNKITGEVNLYDFDFTHLFFDTCKQLNIDISKLDKNNTYVFELVTECNPVVNNYDGRSLTLLAIRNLKTFDEYDMDYVKNVSENINCNFPVEYNFKTEQEILNSLRNVKFGDVNFEGYIIIDNNFNRLKVKSNTYIVYSQFNGDITSKYRLVGIVFDNEIEEVVSNFPALEEQLLDLKSKLDVILEPVKSKFHELKSKHDDLEKKDFFIEGSKSINHDKKLKPFLSIFSSLAKNKELTYEEALGKLNLKSIYKIVK